MPSIRSLVVLASLVTSASAFAQSAPTVQECAVRWHVPFDSELRGSCEKADDKVACEGTRATVASMDHMYSSCMLLVHALKTEGRNPWDVHAQRIAFVEMIDKHVAYSAPLTILADGECWRAPISDTCRAKFSELFVNERAALIKMYLDADESRSRIDIDRELVESYQPPADRMVFTEMAQGNAAEWVTGYGVIADETPRDFAAFLYRTEDHSRQLSLNSPGGSLRGGLALGELIRARLFDEHHRRGARSDCRHFALSFSPARRRR